MDYSEAITVVDDALKRLREALPRGRWNEAIDLSLLAEQHLIALRNECKRRKAQAEAPADHAPRRLVSHPDPPRHRPVYAHLVFPDEP